jgi:hypothetical protein
MRKIQVQIIEHAAPGKDLIIMKTSDSNLVDMSWRPHEEFVEIVPEEVTT